MKLVPGSGSDGGDGIFSDPNSSSAILSKLLITGTLSSSKALRVSVRTKLWAWRLELSLRFFQKKS